MPSGWEQLLLLQGLIFKERVLLALDYYGIKKGCGHHASLHLHSRLTSSEPYMGPTIGALMFHLKFKFPKIICGA